MCRWLAYFSEEPILLYDVFARPEHSLLKQVDLHYLPGIQHPAADSGPGSQNALTNIDGYGFAWYSDIQSRYRAADTVDPQTGKIRRAELPRDMPTVLKGSTPPIHDLNLQSVFSTVESSVCFGHIRATVGSPVSMPNSHPFQFGRWLFMHNGAVGGFFDAFDAIRSHISREAKLVIKGTTDTEYVAALFFTFLEPHGPWLTASHSFEAVTLALKKTISLLVSLCTPSSGSWLDQNGEPKSWISLNLAITDGEQFYALRYAYPPERPAPSLYWSSVGGSSLDRRYKRHPDGGPDSGRLSNDDHLPHVVVASEPMTQNKEDQWKLLQNGQLVYVTTHELRLVADAREHQLAHHKLQPPKKDYFTPRIVNFHSLPGCGGSEPFPLAPGPRRSGRGRSGNDYEGVRLSGPPHSVLRPIAPEHEHDFPVLPHSPIHPSALPSTSSHSSRRQSYPSHSRTVSSRRRSFSSSFESGQEGFESNSSERTPVLPPSLSGR
ncbi:hypothetical protein JCM8547_003316 [Rhodosporidiobolus lusitaniae]